MCKNERTNLFERIFLVSGMYRVSLSNVPSTHESRTFPTHTAHTHHCYRRVLLTLPACYGGAVALNMNEHRWMSGNHRLQRGRQWVTRVQTAWQLLTERDWTTCCSLCYPPLKNTDWSLVSDTSHFCHIVLSLYSLPTYKWDAESMHWN